MDICGYLHYARARKTGWQIIGKPKPYHTELKKLSVGQDLPGQAVELNKIPGLLGLYDV